MSTAPTSLEFTPTGVWLDHLLASEEPPMELFQEFVRRGGRGVILSGNADGPELTARAVNMVHELGLHAIVTVYIWDLREAAIEKAGLEQIAFMVSSADALLLTYGISTLQEITLEQQMEMSGRSEVDPDLIRDYTNQLPEKPWLLAVQPVTARHEIVPNLYPGPLLGFMLDRVSNSPELFPSPQEAKDSVDTWAKNLGGANPVIYRVPEIDSQNPGTDINAVPGIALNIRNSGVHALAIDSRQYAGLPELRDAAEALAGFPDEITGPLGNGRIIGTHDGEVLSVAVTPRGQVVSGGDDGVVRLWDLAGGEEREPLGRHDGIVWSVAVTPGGQVVSGGDDGTVRLWDLAVGEERKPLGKHDDSVLSVAVTPGGQVVVGGADGTVRLWDLAGGEERRLLGRHDSMVWSVAVTPNGQVVSGGDDGWVRLWDLAGGRERELLGKRVGWVRSVAVTPGGQVVSGGDDGTVRVWDLAGDAEREPLGRHDGEVWSVAVTPGGQVVSGGWDGTVRLWDLDGGGEREPLGRHDGAVLSLAVTPGGQVVSGGRDGTVRVWDTPGAVGETPSISMLDFQPSAVNDAASGDDLLDFGALVNGLDTMLNHPKSGLPLAIAVTAPWGAGKSSVMLQLKNRLEKGGDGAGEGLRRRWYTVEFPAWRYEKSERLWAALAKKIYDVQQTQIKHPWARAWFRISLEWSRLGWWQYLGKNLALPVIVGGIAVLGWVLTDLEAGVMASLGGGGSGVLAIFTSGGFSGIVGSPFKRSVNAYAARPKFEEQLGFTAEAQRDIEKLMKKLAPKPKKAKNSKDGVKPQKAKAKPEQAIAVFVDDLDRCSPKHVVEVIEAINQIFNSFDANCVFILGMDRQVVASSIEVAYLDMVNYLSDRKIPLADDYGYRFLEKIVQMSISVPPADQEGMKRLLAAATGFAPPPQETGSGQAPVAVEAEPPPPELVTERIKRLRAEPISNPVDVRQQRLRLEAETPVSEVEQRAWDEAEKTLRTEHLDSDSPDVLRAEFAALAYLDTNPRQVKRFASAFRLQLHVANETGDRDFPLSRLMALAKWVAIRLRWPHLAEELDRDPGLLKALEENAFAEEGAASLYPRNPWLDNEDLLKVLKDQTYNPDKLTNIIGRSLLRVA